MTMQTPSTDHPAVAGMPVDAAWLGGIAPRATTASGGPAGPAFLAQVAHELRTPLTTLNAALGLMRRRIDGPEADPQVAHLFGLARSGTERLMTLVEDWLDLAALEGGTFSLARGIVPAGVLLEGAVQQVEAAAGRRDVRLVVHVATTRALDADAPRLQRAIVHLLDRAVLATAPGRELQVTIADTADGVRIAVSGTTAPLSTSAPGGAVGVAGAATLADHGDPRAAIAVLVCREIVARHGGMLAIAGAGGDDAVVVLLPAA